MCGVHTCLHVHRYMSVHMCAYVCMCVVCQYVYVCLCTYVCMCLCMCVCVCMYVCVVYLHMGSEYFSKPHNKVLWKNLRIEKTIIPPGQTESSVRLPSPEYPADLGITHYTEKRELHEGVYPENTPPSPPLVLLGRRAAPFPAASNDLLDQN